MQNLDASAQDKDNLIDGDEDTDDYEYLQDTYLDDVTGEEIEKLAEVAHQITLQEVQEEHLEELEDDDVTSEKFEIQTS